MSDTGKTGVIFETLVPKYSNADKLASLKREIAMRKNVYPRWVESGRMKKNHADREIAIMEAIARDYEDAKLAL